MNYREMLDQLTTRARSERRAAEQLHIAPTSFNAWRRGRALPDDEQARRIAELLDLDPAYCLAIIHAERAKSDATRAAWQRIAALFDKTRNVATGARRARNTQCSTGGAAHIILRSLGLRDQQLAL